MLLLFQFGHLLTKAKTLCPVICYQTTWTCVLSFDWETVFYTNTKKQVNVKL